MLLGNNKSEKANIFTENDEDLILHLLATECFAEAYQLLISTKDLKRNATNLFNLSLCYFYVENYPKTIYTLDEASASLNIVPSNQKLIVDDVYKSIRLKQNQRDNYIQAITQKQTLHFPETIKDNILRLKVDCYLNLEQWQKVLEIVAPIRNKQYKNVDTAISIAQKKLNQ